MINTLTEEVCHSFEPQISRRTRASMLALTFHFYLALLAAVISNISTLSTSELKFQMNRIRLNHSFDLHQDSNKLSLIKSVEISRFKRLSGVQFGTSSSNLEPQFSAPIANVSAVVGRDVRLVCSVENLGQHQVAWLKEETKTILSIDTNIIITNYRIFLIPDELGKRWVLHIKDVRESDRGFYQCQVNTNPMRSTSGYLEVVVPPSFVEAESSSQLIELAEHSNVSLQCKASGHPRPSIGWRRGDGQPIRLRGFGIAKVSEGQFDEELNKAERYLDSSLDSPGPNDDQKTTSKRRSAKLDQPTSISHLNDVRSDKLELINVDRTMGGQYVCIASNGIPSQVSRQIELQVKFVPKVTIVGQEQVHFAKPGDQLELDCLIESFPKPTSYWSGGRQSLSARNFDRLVAPNGQQSFGVGDHNEAQILLRNGRRSPFVGSAISSRHHQDQVVGETARRRSLPDLAALNDVMGPRIGRPGQNQTSFFRLVRNNDQQPQLDQQHHHQSTFITVKQTVLNQFTYRLRLSLAKLRSIDFGEYVCVATNSVGTSSARIEVKNKYQEDAASQAAFTGFSDFNEQTSNSLDREADYQRDSLADSSNQLVQVSPKLAADSIGSNPQQWPRPTNYVRQTNRVYDENYLQAIRNRQSLSGFTNGQAVKLQQKLKLSSSGDLPRNSASTIQQIISIPCLLLGQTLNLCLLCLYLF